MKKTIRLKLNVDTKQGEDSIKKLTQGLKGISTTMAGSTGSMAAITTGTVAASVGMLAVGNATMKTIDKLAKLKATSNNYKNKLIELNSIISKQVSEVRELNSMIMKNAGFFEKNRQAIRDNIKLLSKEGREIKKLKGAIDAKIKVIENDTKTIKKNTRAIKKNTKATDKQIKKQKGLKQALFGLRSYYLAVVAATTVATITIVKFFTAGFMAVDRFKLAVASSAAAITTFSDLSAGNVDEVYYRAAKYSEHLALKLEIINMRTIATGEQLRSMSDTFIHHGILLDANSKEQEDSFVAIANAISLITQGQNQEIQMRQEVRGLLSGEIKATNILARMIDTKLGGGLKRNLKLWREQDTVLIELGKHLKGFKAGSEDLASTWAAVSTTFSTIIDRYLRDTFAPIYKDIIAMSLSISRNILEQEENTKGVVVEVSNLHKAWESVKKIVISVNKLTEGDGEKEPSWVSKAAGKVDFLGAFVHGALTLSTALEVAVDRLKSLGDEAGEGFAESFIEEWFRKVNEASKTIKSSTSTEKPELLGIPAESSAAALRLQKEISRAEIQIKKEGYEEKRALLALERRIRIKNAKETGEKIEQIEKLYTLKTFNLFLKQLDEDKRKKEESLKEDKGRLERNTELVRSYISTDLENTIHTINQRKRVAIKAAKDIGAAETTLHAIKQKANSEIFQETQASLKVFVDVEDKKKEAVRSTYLEWIESTKSMVEISEELAQQGTESFISGITDNLWEFVDGTKSANKAFKDFAMSFGKELTLMYVKALMLKGIQELLGMAGTVGAASAGASAGASATSFFGGSAKGNVFSNGMKMTEYAKGGIVNSPTLFPMANGAGLMGEDGPEGILPLTRVAGNKLGVETSGRGGQTIHHTQTININAVDSRSFAEAIERNPGAIVNVIDTALKDNSGLNDTIRRTT